MEISAYRSKNPEREARSQHQQALLEKWRITGRPLTYKELFDSLEGIARHLCRKFCSKNPWASYEEVMNDICLPPLVRAITAYEGEKSNGMSLSNFVFLCIERDLTAYRKSGIAKLQRDSVSMAEFKEPGEDRSRTLGETLPELSPSPEENVIMAELRNQVANIVHTISGVVLTPRQREVAKQYLFSDQSCRQSDIAEAFGVSRPAISADVSRIYEILESAIPRDREGNRETPLPQDHLLRHFIPDLALDSRADTAEHLRKLSTAGVEFTSDGIIDLTKAGSHRFNLLLFRMKDGTYRSGLELLEESGSASVFDFFKRDGMDPASFILPKKDINLLQKQRWPKERNFKNKKDYDLTRDEIATAVRMMPNLQTILQLFDIRHREGKWTGSASSKVFRTKWCNINGGHAQKTGPTLLQMCRIEGQDQDAIKEFFELVFDEEIEFSIRPDIVVSYKERFGQDRIFADLQHPNNLRLLSRNGIKLEGDTCSIDVEIQRFRNEVKLDIAGKKIRAKTVMANLDLPATQDGLVALCQKLFPGKKVINRKKPEVSVAPALAA